MVVFVLAIGEGCFCPCICQVWSIWYMRMGGFIWLGLNSGSYINRVFDITSMVYQTVWSIWYMVSSVVWYNHPTLNRVLDDPVSRIQMERLLAILVLFLFSGSTMDVYVKVYIPGLSDERNRLGQETFLPRRLPHWQAFWFILIIIILSQLCLLVYFMHPFNTHFNKVSCYI